MSLLIIFLYKYADEVGVFLPEGVHELSEFVGSLWKRHDDVDDGERRRHALVRHLHQRAEGTKQDQPPELVFPIATERQLVQRSFILLRSCQTYSERWRKKRHRAVTFSTPLPVTHQVCLYIYRDINTHLHSTATHVQAKRTPAGRSDQIYMELVCVCSVTEICFRNFSVLNRTQISRGFTSHRSNHAAPAVCGRSYL